MDLRFTRGRISFSKEVNELDRLALDFSAILRRQKVHHVFVAGYVAILFGRSRVSEDIDVLMEEVTAARFGKLWKGLTRRFECQNASTPETAFRDYLDDGLALRFSPPGQAIPNVEVRFGRTDTHKWSLREPVEVVVNRRRLAIGPMELQIAYKVWLGSDKDNEDARHLFRLFEEHLRRAELIRALRALKVPLETAGEVLGWP